MASQNSNFEPRSVLAYVTLVFALIALTVLGATVIGNNPAKAMDVFNVILPVFASWVGTILAFYFGRENFESANKRVMEIVQQITPEKRGKHPIKKVMRTLNEMTCLRIPKSKSDKDIVLSELKQKLVGDLSRLPVLDDKDHPRYMIHESSIDKYLATGGKESDTLEQFIESQDKVGKRYDNDAGFVLVSEETILSAAKQRMDQTRNCQDIFITANGKLKEQLVGWVSNVRLAKFMEAS